MLRRFIFILVLLTISFFVYRRINPEKADALVDKIKATYNSILGRTGTVELLTGEAGDVLSGELLTPTESGQAPTLSGQALQTGGLLDNVDKGTNTGANENVLTPTESGQAGNTSVTPSLQATPETTGSSNTGTAPTPDKVEEPEPTPKPASKPRNSSDTQDTQNLINNLFQ